MWVCATLQTLLRMMERVAERVSSLLRLPACEWSSSDGPHAWKLIPMVQG